MTERDYGLLRNAAALDQGQAKLLALHYASWTRGDRLRCLDDRQGAHFLRRGEVYTILDVQRRHDTGEPVIFLAGAIIGWEPERFERV